MARKKSDGGVPVIVDSSWPLNYGVNNCVPSDNFDFVKGTPVRKYNTLYYCHNLNWDNKGLQSKNSTVSHSSCTS